MDLWGLVNGLNFKRFLSFKRNKYLEICRIHKTKRFKDIRNPFHFSMDKPDKTKDVIDEKQSKVTVTLMSIKYKSIEKRTPPFPS